MDEFKVGDVVYLKSGSDAMTITTIDGNSCRVTWHDKKGIEQLSSYPKQALTTKNPKIGYPK
jgi:uncharacterized protein YodC (DUF2158 family)